MERMSIPVDLAALGAALSRHDVAYLLTSGEQRPHVVQVFPHLHDGVLVVTEPGRTARHVVGERPHVSFLLPPREPDDYSLIIDGEAALDADGTLRVRPSHAVLHRAGPAGDEAAGDCGNDCRPIG